MKDRLPTEDNLKKRNIIVEDFDLVCPLCLHQKESLNYYIFIHCDVTSLVWNECYKWLFPNFAVVAPDSPEGHYWMHSVIGRSSAECHIWKVIWWAIIFWIWREKNKCIFGQHAADWKTIVYDINFLVWSWLSSLSSAFGFS